MILLKQMANPHVEVKLFIQEDKRYRVVVQTKYQYVQGNQPDYELFDNYTRAETYAKDCLIWE